MRPRLVSAVYDRGAPDEADRDTLERQRADARRRLWHGMGVVVVDPEDLPEWERRAVLAYAEKTYGRRGRA